MTIENVLGIIGVPNLKILTDFGAFLKDGNAPAFVFNLVFCATAATIVSGAMAERTRFISYCIYSGVISLFVYPIEAGWVWNQLAGKTGLSRFCRFRGDPLRRRHHRADRRDHGRTTAGQIYKR